MEHSRLGDSGLLVSRLALGTMTMGLQCDPETSVAILDTAAQAGVTFLDTADVYPLGGGPDLVGRTEEILGGWLAGRRDQFVIATKGSGRTGSAPWDQGNSRQHLLRAVEGSLRRLRTDHLDLYQLHAPDPHTPIEETLHALDDLVRSGKVRYLGCSNFLAYQVATALGRSDAAGLARFVGVQPRYNLLFRQAERELFPLCRQERLGVLAYNPLAGGLLTGKHRSGDGPADGTRFGLPGAGELYRGRYWHNHAFTVVEKVTALAAEAGMRPATLALAWVLADPVVTAPIVGASRPEQLADCLAAADVRLDPDLVGELNRITRLFRWGDDPF